MIKQILSILVSKVFGSNKSRRFGLDGLQIFGSKEPRKKYKQERTWNIIITLILTILALVAFRRKNVRGVVLFFALLILHNIFPDGYIHTSIGIYCGFGIVLTSLFYTTQALMQLMGYKPTIYTLKRITHEHE